MVVSSAFFHFRTHTVLETSQSKWCVFIKGEINEAKRQIIDIHAWSPKDAVKGLKKWLKLRKGGTLLFRLHLVKANTSWGEASEKELSPDAWEKLWKFASDKLSPIEFEDNNK